MLIAGPTASGKSALALALAERLGGVVVNADSMQVYRDLRILTARPTPEEEARVPHWLYGHVDAAENYSVGRYLRDMQKALQKARDDAQGQGLLPIVVGGTGLYFKALTTGLSDIPLADPAIRLSLLARLEAEGVEHLHAELMRIDPATARRVMPRDASRILRGLEVFEATGQPLSEWHKEALPPVLAPGSAVKVFLDVEREPLKDRIHARFDAMLETGAIEEVQKLSARGLPEHLPAMKAHGVPWLCRSLRGEISREEAAEGGKMDTRRYAKRQVTWFRNQMPDWIWLRPDVAEADILARLARAPEKA